MKVIRILAMLLLTLCAYSGCGSDAEELLDLAKDPPERKPINRSLTGVNNFFVNSEFGTISAQFEEIRDSLGLHMVRVLFAWDDNVQPSAGASPNYSFFDDIVEQIPSNVDVVVVLAHTPSWMTNSSNWIDGNPRKTWVERWVRPTVARYAGRRGIVGWEVWNEPDLTVVASDAALGLETAQNYFELLNLAAPVIRNLDPTRLVVIAATQSIQQKYSAPLDYNRVLRDLGAENLVDVWNIHYYGEQYENVVRNNGVAEFLNSLSTPIWVTESATQGVNNQLAYAERTWGFLRDEIPGIDRIYWYEFSSRSPVESTFGLRTTNQAFPVSDLYVHLRDAAE